MLIALAALASARTVQTTNAEVASARLLPMLRGLTPAPLRLGPAPRRPAPVMGVSDRMATDGLLYEGWGKEGMANLEKTTAVQRFAKELGISHFTAVLMVSQRAKELDDAAREEDTSYVGNSFGGSLGAGARKKKPAKSLVVLAVEQLLEEANETKLAAEQDDAPEMRRLPSWVQDFVPPNTPPKVLEKWDQRDEDDERTFLEWLESSSDEETGVREAGVGKGLHQQMEEQVAAALGVELLPLREKKGPEGVKDEPWEEGAIEAPEGGMEGELEEEAWEEGEIEAEAWEEGEGELSEVEESGTGGTGNVEDLAALTIPELKEQLRARGLRVGGKKAELVERLAEARRGDGGTDAGAEGDAVAEAVLGPEARPEEEEAPSGVQVEQRLREQLLGRDTNLDEETDEEDGEETGEEDDEEEGSLLYDLFGALSRGEGVTQEGVEATGMSPGDAG